MKSSLFILVFSLVFSACLPFNRMTSPEVLEQSERTWVVGTSIETDLGKGGRDGFIALDGAGTVSPVIGYRSGMEGESEWGLTLYTGIIPTLVYDYKHVLYQSGDFFLSGDAAVFAGYPLGLQYDLIAGNRKLYGTAGLAVNTLLFELSEITTFANFGLGTEFSKDSPFGLQLSFSIPFYNAIEYSNFGEHPYIFLGGKINFTATKKKYR